MAYKLYHGDCLSVLKDLGPVQCIFADPPDNIGLGYDSYEDKLPTERYEALLHEWIHRFVGIADIVWLSFNSRWTSAVGSIIHQLCRASLGELEFKPCVQVFTFGQHRSTDLGNNHRPLWRLMRKGTPLYPEQIKVPSWRQRNGDKRAAAGGRVPGDVFDMQYPSQVAQALRILQDFEEGSASGSAEVTEAQRLLEGANAASGDVFDFPRVTGNSKQRCDWHPTQLHEELVERCLLLSTKEGDQVLDPFGGTGTTMRVSRKINRPCTLIEYDTAYCEKIAEANGLQRGQECWSCSL